MEWIEALILKWQALIGPLISGGFTLIAAAIAWRAVQRQMGNQQAIAEREQNDTLETIKEGAAGLYGMLNLIWRVADVTLANKWPEHHESNFALLRNLVRSLPDNKNIDALVEIAERLRPRKRRQFLLAINAIRSLCRHCSHYEETAHRSGVSPEEELEDRKYYVINLRTYLSHVAKYLEAFDPASTAIFDGRVRARVDHRHMHEQLETCVAQAERGENWMK